MDKKTICPAITPTKAFMDVTDYLFMYGMSAKELSIRCVFIQVGTRPHHINICVGRRRKKYGNSSNNS